MIIWLLKCNLFARKLIINNFKSSLSCFAQHRDSTKVLWWRFCQNIYFVNFWWVFVENIEWFSSPICFARKDKKAIILRQLERIIDIAFNHWIFFWFGKIANKVNGLVDICRRFSLIKGMQTSYFDYPLLALVLTI